MRAMRLHEIYVRAVGETAPAEGVGVVA
jgi:hypothetical protein